MPGILNLFQDFTEYVVTFLLAQKSNQKKAVADKTAYRRRGYFNLAFELLW